jgi:serine/threonine protein kinase
LNIGTRLKIGQFVYLLDRSVGRGGFGRVFHAIREAPSSGEAAIKFLSESLRHDETWLAKFEREARILANLSHQNVVKILHFWRLDDGTMALAQEFVRGARNLTEVFANPDADRVGLYLQALYGLRAIHGNPESGVVHRDISPANLLVDENGFLKIIDFGLAKEQPRVTEILTTSGEYFGTPGCMAPEQKSDAAGVDQRADLYGLGRSFAAAFQGRSPEHVDLSQLPKPWRGLLKKMAAFSAADRHPDVGSAIDEAMECFAAVPQTPASMAIHVDEMHSWRVRKEALPRSWPVFCSTYFKRRADANELMLDDLAAAAKLGSAVFQDPRFAADAVFDGFENGDIGTHFHSGASSFDGADPFGTYLRATYKALTPSRRTSCFRRLVRTTVMYHRYGLMAHVRSVFEREDNAGTQSELLQILEEEDRNRLIEGRGIIPGR